MSHRPRANQIVFGAPQQNQRAELTAVLGAALHSPPGRMDDWLAALENDSLRAVWQRGQIVAGLGMIRMAQWFGGARVPMVGLTAVGVAPATRGTGIGSLMLRRTLAELHAEGIALSALYPATLPFYQRAGYMRAGQRITYSLPLEAIDVREDAGELLPIESAHYPQLRQIYEHRAISSAGNLDRPEWMWQQKFEPKEAQVFRFLVVCDGQPEGYIVLTQAGRSDPLMLVDVCTLTPVAARRLLSLCASYRSMVEHMTWHSGPRDPFVYLIRENLIAGMHTRVRTSRALEWMLRIIDVQQALSRRGYPHGLNAELHLDIHDDLLPGNNGRFILHVSDGRGVVSPGGQGRLALSVGELAAIYSGFMAPAELKMISTINASESDLTLAGAVFSGAHPWIGDMF
ncbi:MAG TPA: GNAT family N-acetyltransferase [Herpetosiphonaceae bacterium]